jgi:ribosome-binding protein aMBF1 (putative translation factor)
MIEDAEAESYHVCEICGRHINKQIVEHHWIYPMCRECYDGMKEKQEKIMEEFENKIKAKRKKRENSKD